MMLYHIILWSLSFSLWTVQADTCKNAPNPILYPQGSPVESSQDLNSSAFIGTPASRRMMMPRFKYYPEASLMHTDGGNSGASDYPGPLGINPNISSSTGTIYMMVWGSDGSLTCGYANTSAGYPPRLGLVALEPTTFEILAAWYPPVNETLGFAYMEYIEKTNDIVVNTNEGHIFIVHRDSCNGIPYFTTTRTIALASVLRQGEGLLNSMYDTAGNIWFTSGAISSRGDTQENSTTFGYITPKGKVVQTRVKNEMVENGIAVSGMDVYMVTGPSGAADTHNAAGYMYSMTSDGRGGIKIRWKVPYNAGSGTRIDPTSRGSGSTPALLADKYVAITDKSDSQVNLNVYHQEAKGSKGKQLVCQVPLFKPGKSNSDNSVTGYFDGNTYGIMIQNSHNRPRIYNAQPGKPADVDGKWNDMSIMAGGLERIDIDADGNCSVRWTSDMAVKAVPILSTNTGLIYNYVEDTERSPKGEYVWYVAGVDWDTGETVFKIRTGTGGTFNDNWTQGTLGPDGAFYQTVFGGIVAVKDGQ